MEYFAENLRMVCGLYPSVAEVSRKLGLNRQQLNKYLNGSSRPSMYTFSRICDFFAVDESEFLLPPSEFRALVSNRRRSIVAPPQVEGFLNNAFSAQAIQDNARRLEAFLGVYYLFQDSPLKPKHINKLCAVIYRCQNGVTARFFEAAPSNSSRGRKRVYESWDALVRIDGDKLNFFDASAHTSGSCHFSMMTFFAQGAVCNDVFVGMHLNGRGALRHQITSGVSVLQRICRGSLRPSHLREVGVFEQSAEDIPEIVQDLVSHAVLANSQNSLMLAV